MPATKNRDSQVVNIPPSRKGGAATDGFSEAYRDLLDLSQDYILVLNHEGLILFANQMLSDCIYPNAKHFKDIIDRDHKKEFETFFRQLGLENERQAKDFCTQIICADQTRLSLDWKFQNNENYILAIGRDYTALRHQTEMLRQQERQLSEAQAIGHMGHWHWRVGNEELAWSDELFRIFDVEKGHFIPTLDGIGHFLHKRDLGRLMQGFQRAILEKKDYEMEFRIIRATGKMRYVRCEGRCELDEDGDVCALYGIMQDITERVLYEEELKSAKDAAERAYAAKSQFLANMSHELRTPLNAVIGFSEMMQREVFGPLGDDKYREYIKNIKDSGEHLLDLITDILDMSKMEAGKYELDLEDINLKNILMMVRNMLSGRAEESNVKLQILQENETRKIYADRRALTQILINLISNAIKFSESGKDVVVECLERENYLLIRVKDEGVGIPANRLPFVTRPFEQAGTQYTRNHEGSGLGLAITKELIELHCGSMHIESHVGVGTTVSVRLPYDAYSERKQRESLAEQQISSDNNFTSPQTTVV